MRKHFLRGSLVFIPAFILVTFIVRCGGSHRSSDSICSEFTSDYNEGYELSEEYFNLDLGQTSRIREEAESDLNNHWANMESEYRQYYGDSRYSDIQCRIEVQDLNDGRNILLKTLDEMIGEISSVITVLEGTTNPSTQLQPESRREGLNRNPLRGEATNHGD